MTQFRHISKNLSHVIGLTGNICGGKSHIRGCLESLGAVAIDADIAVHNLYKQNAQLRTTLQSTFGDSIIKDDNIDRVELRKLVRTKEQLKQLNGLVWPAALEAVKQELATKANKRDGKVVGVIEAALLVEGGWHRHCDSVWLANVERDEAILRLMARNNISMDDATVSYDLQRPVSEKLLVADVVVDTSGPKEVTAAKVAELFTALQKRIKADEK